MKRIYRFVSSLHLGIVLLVTLTVLSLVGVIIPQRLEPQQYVNQWGSIGGGLLLRSGLDRLFSTLWYNTLLGLFGLNILLCTVNRLKSITNALTHPQFLSAEKIQALPCHAELQSNGTPEAVAEKAFRFFRERHFSASLRRNADGVLIDAQRGRVRDLGSALLHLCLILLLVGGLVGRMTGFSYPQQLSPGESAPVRERPFSVRCDFFELERNARGAIKDYKSGLTLLDSGGDTLARKVIEVNRPLAYDGIKFYQSSYREDPLDIDNIELVVTGPLIGAIGRKVRLQPGRAGMVTGTDITVIADRFMPDFFYDMETKQPHNRSHNHNNPALFVTMMKGVDTLFARWVFKRFGTMHHDEDTYGAVFLSYDRRQSTGLLIKENPGSALIWLGIIGMSIGILLVFWVVRQRYWAAIGSTGGDDIVRLTIGCTQKRENPDAAARLDEVAGRLSESINGEKGC